MTDKATVEIPSPRAGRIVEADVRRGADLPGGQVLVAHRRGRRAARRRPSAAAAPQTPTPGAGPAAIRRRRRPAARRPARRRARRRRRPRPTATSATTSTSTRRVLATPATRKLARELGVDLGAGRRAPGRRGRITSDDVRGAGGRRQRRRGRRRRSRGRRSWRGGRRRRRQAADVRVPFRGLRRQIAEHMVRAKHEAAHFTYVEEVDCTQLVGLREKANARLAARRSSSCRSCPSSSAPRSRRCGGSRR